MNHIDCSVSLLNPEHERHQFNCGEQALNQYLHNLAGQHARKNISRTFVILSPEHDKQVLGYYTLSAGNINFQNIPDALKKRLPQYPIPVIRLGRLAVDLTMQQKGVGEYLLMDALYRCVSHSEAMGVFGVLVDAKHDRAKQFYMRYGFIELTNEPLSLVLPIKDISINL